MLIALSASTRKKGAKPNAPRPVRLRESFVPFPQACEVSCWARTQEVSFVKASRCAPCPAYDRTFGSPALPFSIPFVELAGSFGVRLSTKGDYEKVYKDGVRSL